MYRASMFRSGFAKTRDDLLHQYVTALSLYPSNVIFGVSDLRQGLVGWTDSHNGVASDVPTFLSAFPGNDMYVTFDGAERLAYRFPTLSVSGRESYYIGSGGLFDPDDYLVWYSPRASYLAGEERYVISKGFMEQFARLDGDGTWHGDGWIELFGRTGIEDKGTRLNGPPGQPKSVRYQFNGWRQGGSAQAGYDFTYEGDRYPGSLYGYLNPAGIIKWGNPSWRHADSGRTFIRDAQPNGDVHFTGMSLENGTYRITIGATRYKSAAMPENGQDWAFEPEGGEGDGVTLDWDGVKSWAITRKVFLGQGLPML